MDAAWDNSTNTAAIGWVIRDNEGRVICAAEKSLANILSALFVECLTIREGLFFAAQRSIRVVSVASDSLRAMQRVHRKPVIGILGSIIGDIFNFLGSLQGDQCYWIPRNNNGVA